MSSDTVTLALKVDLVRAVTARLLVAFLCLFGAALGAMSLSALLQVPTPCIAPTIAFGMFGGFASIQRRVKTLTSDDLHLLATSWPYILLAPFVAGLLAVLLYCLFIGEMLQGDLFPAFEAGETNQQDLSRLFAVRAVRYQDYAKLLVWSFLAGYSETFVTDVVGSFAPSHSADNKASATAPHVATEHSSPQ